MRVCVCVCVYVRARAPVGSMLCTSLHVYSRALIRPLLICMAVYFVVNDDEIIPFVK